MSPLSILVAALLAAACLAKPALGLGCGRDGTLHGCGTRLSPADFNTCLTELVQNNLRTLAAGAPGLNLPGYDPLYAGDLTLVSSGQTATLQGCQFVGLSNLRTRNGEALVSPVTGKVSTIVADLIVPHASLQCASSNVPAGFLGVSQPSSGSFKLDAVNYTALFNWTVLTIDTTCAQPRFALTESSLTQTAASSFRATFSSLSPAANSALNEPSSELVQLVISALEPKQKQVLTDDINNDLKFFPAIPVIFPDNTANPAKFCWEVQPC